MALREKYGEWDAWKAPTRTKIQYPSTCTEVHQFRNGQGVENMMLIKIVNILAGNDVYLGVPLPVKPIEHGEALFLLFREVRKVFL